MKDIAKWTVYAGIFLVPAVVLIISNSLFFPYITGKNFAFRIIVEIVFAAWIILALYDSQYRPRFSWIGFSFLVLLVIMFFANLFGVHPLQSFWSNFERMEGYVTLVHTFMYFLVVGSVMKTEKLWDQFFLTTVFVAIILSFYAFAQLSGQIAIQQGGGRLDGTLGNSAYMAIYALFHIFIGIFLLLRAKTPLSRYFFGTFTLLYLYLLIQTATRGTTLGLIGGLFVMVTYITLFSRNNPTIRKVATGGIITMIAIVALFVTFKESSFIQGNPYLQRLSTISLKEGQNRFMIWGMALKGVEERPLLGWGQSNFGYVFNEYYRPELHGQEAWFDRVHDIVMDWLIAGGILGAIAYFSILLSAVYYLFVRPITHSADERFSVVERGVLLGLLAGYTIHNIFVFDNIVSYIFYGTILAYIHTRVALPIEKIERWRIDGRIVEQVVAPITLIILIVTVYYVNVPGIQAAGDIIDGFRATRGEEVLASFERALSRGSFGTQEIREQMMQRVQPLLQDPNLSEEFKQKAFKRVEEELLKQLEEKPGDARAHVFISSFYRMTNNLEPAIEQLAKAREFSPQKQLIIFEQGMAEIQRGDYQKALGFFEEAYKLGPQFTESRVLYASAAVYADQLGLVDELIKTSEDKRAFALNDIAVGAVYAKRMYPRLIEMFKIRAEVNPNDPQIRTNLAFILNESGDKKGAIEVLQKAANDIPSFKEQAEGFIASLVAPAPKVEVSPAQ